MEVLSAFARLEQDHSVNPKSLDGARASLSELRRSWIEIVPSDRVRTLAESIPRRHNLRAGDSFQLAAALVWCDERPQNRHFVSLDRRLAKAARDAGFTAISEIG